MTKKNITFYFFSWYVNVSIVESKHCILFHQLNIKLLLNNSRSKIEPKLNIVRNDLALQ